MDGFLSVELQSIKAENKFLSLLGGLPYLECCVGNILIQYFHPGFADRLESGRNF
jgi:hypothetical protein